MTAPLFSSSFSGEASSGPLSAAISSVNTFFSSNVNSLTTDSFTVSFSGGVSPYSLLWRTVKNTPSVDPSVVVINESSSPPFSVTASLTGLPPNRSVGQTLKVEVSDASGQSIEVSTVFEALYFQGSEIIL